MVSVTRLVAAMRVVSVTRLIPVMRLAPVTRHVASLHLGELYMVSVVLFAILDVLRKNEKPQPLTMEWPGLFDVWGNAQQREHPVS